MAMLSKPLTQKLGDYYTGKASESLADSTMLQAARMRRRQLSRMTKAYDRPTAKTRLPDTNYAISRKVDGEFTCLFYKDGEVITLNPGGTIRAGAPFHKEAAEILSQAGIKEAMFGGELHVRHDNKQRELVHDVVRVARAPDSQDAIDSLCFAVFNVNNIDGQDLSMHYDQAIEKVQSLFGQGIRVFAVETQVGDRAKALDLFDTWVVEEGSEGIVLRSDSAGVFKVKPRHSIDLAVLGYSEGADDRAGMLHSMLIGVVRDEQHAHIVGRVGGGYSDEQRTELLKQLNTMNVESDYAEVNSDRVAYRMIKPGLVAEISCLDIISSTSHGSAIDRMVIEWDEKNASWKGIRRLPLCSIISPQFVRLRDDKTFSSDDAGLEQLADIVAIPSTEHGKLDTLNLPQSTVMERSVATKTLKGATMVRKLIVWQTNKHEASRDFPAFVLHLTDYSPNRKEPLNHEICVSDSESQIRELFADWKKQYYKRGWKEQ